MYITTRLIILSIASFLYITHLTITFMNILPNFVRILSLFGAAIMMIAIWIIITEVKKHESERE
jgi:hypothetical protein